MIIILLCIIICLLGGWPIVLGLFALWFLCFLFAALTD
jgi:hypothetical protein